MKTYRSGEQAFGLVVMALIFPGFALAIAWEAPDLGLGWRIGFTVMAAVLLFMLLRSAASGARCSPEGLRIRNPFCTVRVPWHQVDRFEIGRWLVYPMTGLAFLTNGKVVHIFGIQAPNPTFRPRNHSAQEIFAVKLP